MHLTNCRKAFSMITAIMVVVLMSTVAVYVMSISSKMTRETTAQFQREQAMLLAKSYTEYSILAVTANDRNTTSGGHCLENIEGVWGDPNAGTGYKIEVKLLYIGNNTGVADCPASVVLASNIETSKSPLSIIVDVYVRYKEPDHPDVAHAPFITYHKRTLQKI